ncbi:M20/M25/M40 family metallo-hydrolase [Streptomyces sp. M10(2022)]
MTYTKSTEVGGIQAALAAVPADDTTGCEAADYASQTFTGKIALIKRGGCSFAEKQAAASVAGAAGAVIYNNTEGVLSGTLGDVESGKLPTGGLTRAEGEKLVADLAKGEVTVSVEIRELQEERTTRNVVAQTQGGNAAKTVMLGAHLDSVTEGPGINDNASGSAGLLEVALELAKSQRTPANKVRFAWWSAEEDGLLGSEAYVSKLSEDRRKQVALYLNFDMIASPNGAQFVFDGDDSDAVGEGPAPRAPPSWSATSTTSSTARASRTRVRTSPGAPTTGRSSRSASRPVVRTRGRGHQDTGPGGEVRRQGRSRVRPCYHAACDDLDNIDMALFDTNIDVIANAVGTYAYDLGS